MPDSWCWPVTWDPQGWYELPDLDELLRRPAWHADAACLEHPEVDFFPGQGEPGGDAVAVCSRCLVRGECLAAALARAEFGIWGGVNQRQRRLMRRGDVEVAQDSLRTQQVAQ